MIDSLVVAPSETVDGASVHSLRVIYPMRVVGGSLRSELAASTDAALWFSLEEAGGLPLVDLGVRGLELALAGPREVREDAS